MIGAKQEASMSEQLRLMIYKEDSINYRYLVHGANPSLRGRFRTPTPLTGDSALVAIKNALEPTARNSRTGQPRPSVIGIIGGSVVWVAREAS
jgi:hypothetical protein